MKKQILFLFTALLMSVAGIAQSNNPIATASISPNPVESKATLTFDEPVHEEITVVIKDLTGKIISQIKPDTQGDACVAVRLDAVDSLRRGIYIIQITGASGKVKTLKFQKT